MVRLATFTLVTRRSGQIVGTSLPEMWLLGKMVNVPLSLVVQSLRHRPDPGHSEMELSLQIGLGHWHVVL